MSNTEQAEEKRQEKERIKHNRKDIKTHNEVRENKFKERKTDRKIAKKIIS